MHHGLGILVWTTLLIGSATVLFLALPDVLSWFLGVRERTRSIDRGMVEHRVMAHTVPGPINRAPGRRHRR